MLISKRTKAITIIKKPGIRMYSDGRIMFNKAGIVHLGIKDNYSQGIVFGYDDNNELFVAESDENLAFKGNFNEAKNVLRMCCRPEVGKIFKHINHNKTQAAFVISDKFKKIGRYKLYKLELQDISYD